MGVVSFISLIVYAMCGMDRVRACCVHKGREREGEREKEREKEREREGERERYGCQSLMKVWRVFSSFFPSFLSAIICSRKGKK